MDIITNNELPIGFSMTLAKDTNAMNAFSNLSAQKREDIVNGSRNIQSKQEMEAYVAKMITSPEKTI